MRLALIFLLAAAIAAALYVRLAPSAPARWHRMPERVETRELTGGAMRVIADAPGRLKALHDIVTATPRTRVLAGSVAEGMVTYVTRSRIFGFPDYTTVRRAGGEIGIYGRLRFGVSDMGVNAARIDGWLRRLGQAAGAGRMTGSPR